MERVKHFLIFWMLTFSIDCHTVHRISHIVLLVVLEVVALTAPTAPTAWQHNNSSVKFWQWQPTDIDSADADGGGTLDRASACPATHIRSYAKTFSKFIAVYNHLSHFHNPALDCDRYHIYVSCLPIKNILLVQALVMYYDFKWLLSHLNHLYTGGGVSDMQLYLSHFVCI